MMNPRVGLAVFIDDLLGETMATEEHLVVGSLMAGAAAVQDVITNDLDCQVAGHKSVLLASGDGLLGKLKASFGHRS